MRHRHRLRLAPRGRSRKCPLGLSVGWAGTPAADQIGSMRDLFKQLLVNQFEAALCTLNACVDRCPDVGNLAF